MTDSMEWLAAKQGLDALSTEEFNAIRDFTLLWGLFEGKAMSKEGSQPRVAAAVERMTLPDPLPAAMIRALDFWRHRYWQVDEHTGAFYALNFRANEHRTLVTEVLSDIRCDRADIVKALLLIILRLRNNLFHGVKWEYRLRDQLGNFTHANQVLMPAIDFAVPPV